MNASPSPPAAANDPGPLANTYGETISTMATRFGMPPQEMGLVIAAILNNLSGPHAALLGPDRRIPLGINLLAVSFADHRLRRALDNLLGSATGLQDLQREEALRGHRGMTDLRRFGAANPEKFAPHGLVHHLDSRKNEMLKVCADDLNGGKIFASNWDVLPGANQMQRPGDHATYLLNERLPGTRHHPSFFFTTNDASQWRECLAETMDQHALFFDPSEGLFRGSFLKSAKAGRQALAELVLALAGEDVAIPRIHPQQGYGLYHRSAVRIMAITPSEALAGMVQSEEGSLRQLLSQCVLWPPTWLPLSSRGPKLGKQAWETYKDA
jgi:hypothetical protein